MSVPYRKTKMKLNFPQDIRLIHFTETPCQTKKFENCRRDKYRIEKVLGQGGGGIT